MARASTWKSARLALRHRESRVLSNKRFILGEPHKNIWLPHYRRMLLEVPSAHLPEMTLRDYLIAKESNAGDGAPLLLGAFPESRVTFLHRDPRDVVASLMDVAAPGSWYPYERFEWAESAATRTLTESCVRSINASQDAYRAHSGLKATISYERLRERPEESLAFLQEQLRMPDDVYERYAAIEGTSREALREDQKGPGKFQRKGVAGRWEQDLTEDQVLFVESAAGPLMWELGYETRY